MALNIRPLTQEQRQAAYQAAQEAVVRAVGPNCSRALHLYYDLKISTSDHALDFRLVPGSVVSGVYAVSDPFLCHRFQTFGQAVSNRAAKMAVGLATVCRRRSVRSCFLWHWRH